MSDREITTRSRLILYPVLAVLLLYLLYYFLDSFSQLLYIL